MVTVPSFSVSIGLLLLGGAVARLILGYWRFRNSPLKRIPTPGSPGYFASYYWSFKFLFNARDIIQEGYNRYPNRAFRVPLLTGWIVLVNGPELIDEIKKAREEDLSAFAAAEKLLQTKYTLDLAVFRDPYHVPVTQRPLNKTLESSILEIQDEIEACFRDEIPNTKDWTAVPAMHAVEKLVCRVNNRVFVGKPLCQDKDYIKLCLQATKNVIIGALALKVTPDILKPIVNNLFTNTETYIRRMQRFVAPLISERKKFQGKEHLSRPSDLIMWLLDEAEGHPKRDTLRDTSLRLLLTNFAANHTTALSFTHALFHLASDPKLADTLREEVQTVSAELGWTKEALSRMRKVDSFLKESARYNPMVEFVMIRTATKDLVLSDGTFIPAGTEVAIPLPSTHFDEALHTNASKFEPFRFLDALEKEGEIADSQLVTLDRNFLSFGLGRHGCPGRWFATAVLKLLLAKFLEYDIKLEGSNGIPPPFRFLEFIAPSSSLRVLLRTRTSGSS